MAYLVINDGSEKGNRIDLTGAAEFFIGRSADKSDVVIPSGSVSGRHCSLAKGDESFLIKDLDSTNGSFLNGIKFTGEQKVYRGDNIVLGDVQMVLLGDDVPVRPDANAAAAGDGATVVQKITPVKAPATEPAAARPRSGPPTLNITASKTVKVLPSSFKKKKKGGSFWIVLIFLASVLAIYLLFVLVKTIIG